MDIQLRTCFSFHPKLPTYLPTHPPTYLLTAPYLPTYLYIYLPTYLGQRTYRACVGLIPLRLSNVNVIAMPVAKGKIIQQDKRLRPATWRASRRSKLVNRTIKEEPAAFGWGSAISPIYGLERRGSWLGGWGEQGRAGAQS